MRKTRLTALAILSGGLLAMAPTNSFESKHSSLRFDYTPAEIDALCKDAFTAAQKAVDALAAIPKKDRNFRTTQLALEAMQNQLEDISSPVHLLKETSTSVEVQEAAKRCADISAAFYAKLFTRSDIYEVLNTATLGNLDLEDTKLTEETLRGFRKSGAALPTEKRTKVAELKEKLSQIENQFATNLAKANDAVELTVAELAGLPQDFIDGLKKSPNGNYLVTLLDASSYLPILENAKLEETRRKVVEAHDKVAVGTNVALLEQAIALRDEVAKLLGFKNHAALVLDSKMAKKPETVDAFLQDLRKKLKQKLDQDLKVLLALKKKDDAKATTINLWDWRYYDNQLKKEKYSVDGEIIREFFPVDHVIQSVFDTYQKILSVKFFELQTTKKWFKEVRLFEVRDAKSDALIGHFFLDLFPRDNKYKHFAAFDIQRARRNADGTYRTPVSAIVGNFPKASGNKPSLLSHEDVETFFHEFGHIMHMTLTTARYSSLSGASVRWDFVEAPSQMLENWVWQKPMLKKLSKNYKSGEPLPDALIDSMIAARHVNEGVFWSRQLFFATADMKFHTSGPKVDTTKIWNDLSADIMKMPSPAGCQAQATFGHLMGGYDAGYYGYLWSKVFAEDMFSVFEKKGLENSEVGGRYREWILSPGGTKEPDVLIHGFLQREPSKEAFYQSLGLK